MYWNLTNKERLFESLKLAAEKPKLHIEFLNDLLTKKEIDDLAKRLEAMCFLHNLTSYTQISKMTGLSSTTIARLSKIISNKEGGFRKIIKKFEKQGKSYWE